MASGNTRTRDGLREAFEYRSIRRRAAEFDRAEREAKARLIQWAQAGDPAALAKLRQRYRLRLPLVEAV